nr:BTB/POZ domain-containing protein At5g66560 [Ipomoea batatas]GMC68615.1 BTB/POZ domain-containing protein At5g66560 [Ipomoea batatas]GME07063.1 BTB/POZ domain-containing protein At5g66560 [Ipomoea batatas]
MELFLRFLSAQFPLMLKSRKLHELITEQVTKPSGARVQKPDAGEIEEEGVEDEGVGEEELQRHISLLNFPAAARLSRPLLSSATASRLTCRHPTWLRSGARASIWR